MPATPRITSDRSPRNRALFTLDAQRLIAAGRAKEAVEICKQGLIYHPENPTGYILLARAYQLLGERDRAAYVLDDGYRRTGSVRLRMLHDDLMGIAPEPVEPEIEPAAELIVEPVDAIDVVEVDEEDEPEVIETIEIIERLDEDILEEGIEELTEDRPATSEEPAQEPVEQPSEEPAEEPVEEPIPTIEPIEATDLPAPSSFASLRPSRDASPSTQEEPPARSDTLATEPAPPEEEWSWRPEESLFVPVEDAAPEPEVEKPEIEQPEVEAPEVERPEVDAPEVETPEKEEPKREEPEIEQPEVQQPEIQQPEIQQLEIQQPEPPSSEAATEQIEPVAEPTPEPAPQPASPEPATGGLRMIGARVAHGGSTARAEQSDRRPLSLALHAGKSISRLRSSNLRLIPGLEFAPLRHEDLLRRQSIAPLISEPMPQPEVRSRAAKKAIEESSLPPLPSLGETAGAAELPSSMSPMPRTEPLPARAQEPAPVEEPRRTELEAPRMPERETPRETPRETQRPKGLIRMAPEPKEPAELTPLEELARRLENARIPVVEEPEQRTAFEPSIVSDTLANILVSQGAYAEALKAFQTLARVKPERFAYYQEKIQEMKWRLQNPGGIWPPGDDGSPL